MSKIAFFHGLESAPVSDKSEYLQSKFPGSYTPAIDYKKSGAFDEVLKEVKKRNIDLLAGSSMGGWFAYCISTLTGIPAVLFNPAVHSRPYDPNVKIGNSRAKQVVVLGKNDDIIDPAKTVEWFKSNGVNNVKFYYENNDHRTPVGIFQKYIGMNERHVMTFESFLNERLINEKKPKGAPEWKDSDAPDAEGRFRDLGIKDLAAWLIKTRDGDLKRISGSLTQQVVFNRGEDPEYAEKMEKVRKEVYRQLGREDLLESRRMNATDMIKYVKSLTPSDSDHPDYFLSLIKKSGKSFELQTLKIADVLKMDKDVNDYVKSGEVRYGEGGVSDLEPYDDELDQPIVIFNNEVIDGYSRTSTLHKRGVKNIQAWVSQ